MSSSPPIVCIQTGDDFCGTGIWVARDFVLTAWHVISADHRHPGDSNAKPIRARSIKLSWRGEELALRSGETIDVRFATREHGGGPRRADVALLHVPLAESSPLLAVEPLPLALGLLGAAGDMLVGAGSSTLEFHGFPSENPHFPSLHDFLPASWSPDSRDNEPNHCVLGKSVEEGYSGGPLLARVGDGALWIGVASLGKYTLAYSGFVLTGAIQRFLKAVAKSKDFHGFQTPPTESLHSALLDEPRKKVVERCNKLYWSSSVRLEDLYVERVVELSVGRDPTPVGAPLALEQHLSAATSAPAPRLVLVADPGAGKSTLLRHVAWKLADTPHAPRFAIDARLPSLREGKWSLASFYDHVEQRCGRYPRLLLEHGDPRGQLTLLLDGYDEVDASGLGLEQVDELLRTLAEKLPRTPILIASRPPFEGADLKAYRRLGVQPLEEAQQFQLLGNIVTRLRKARPSRAEPSRIGDAELTYWVHSIQSDSRFAEDRGNPLWITLAARVVAGRDELPGSRVRLLECIVEDLADGLHARNADAKPSKVGEPAPRGWRAVLEALAYRMTDRSRVQLSLRELVEWLSKPRDEAWAPVPDFGERVETLRREFDGRKFPDAFVAWLGERSILAPTESGDEARSHLDEPHAFWHRSIQEYLTACELRRMWDARGGSERILKLAANAAEEVDTAMLDRLAAAIERIRPQRGQLEARRNKWTHDAFSFESADKRRSDLEKRGRAFIRTWLLVIEDVGDQLNLRRNRSNIKQLDGERFWGEPLGMLAAMLAPEDAEALFESVAKTPSIARRAMQSADSATEVAIRSVLAELMEEEDRGAVLLQVPRLVPASDRALALLAELGKAPRQRADLFFIDEALVALARLQPELESPCRETSASMYRMLVRVDATHVEQLFAWSRVPKGRHKIGERAEVEVDLESFRLSSVTVTRAEYRRFDPEYAPSYSPAVEPNDPDRLPAYQVGWYAATAYARWLGWVLEGAPGRLPTEVEWEVACRAGSTTRWSTGEDVRELAAAAHFDNGDSEGPFEVRQLAPNDWGLFDMHGNVWEWCGNLHEGGPWRVVRGGGYGNSADDCRAASRYWNHPVNRSGYIGFRVVLPAGPAHRDSSFEMCRFPADSGTTRHGRRL
jgi:hypothetical protein